MLMLQYCAGYQSCVEAEELDSYQLWIISMAQWWANDELVVLRFRKIPKKFRRLPRKTRRSDRGRSGYVANGLCKTECV